MSLLDLAIYDRIDNIAVIIVGYIVWTKCIVPMIFNINLFNDGRIAIILMQYFFNLTVLITFIWFLFMKLAYFRILPRCSVLYTVFCFLLLGCGALVFVINALYIINLWKKYQWVKRETQIWYHCFGVFCNSIQILHILVALEGFSVDWWNCFIMEL